MAEDDNFDLDIYGDGGYNGGEGPELILDAPDTNGHEGGDAQYGNDNAQTTNGHDASHQQNIVSTQGTAQTQQQPIQQGQKRKEISSSEDRPADPDATTALFVSELFWWTTDDDIRGWAREADAEDELKDVTFSEHKVNGKSKSQAFVEFTTLQAATAVKHLIEHYANTGQPGRKHSANYTNPHQNPFRTLPKDAPARKDDRVNRQFNQGGNQNMNYGMNNMSGGGGFRGGRGGFNRGGGMGYNNRNFSGGMNNNFQGGGGMGGGGFQNNMGGGMGGNYGGGFNNRGGNMMGGGMRGGPNMRGRGGGPNMGGAPNMMGMGMNPMGAMAMNPAMAGGMNPMMGNMGMGFQAGNFNPNFGGGFQGNPQMGGSGDQGSWNPHGAKRTRQE